MLRNSIVAQWAAYYEERAARLEQPAEAMPAK
jgi:hypothetical protein